MVDRQGNKTSETVEERLKHVEERLARALDLLRRLVRSQRYWPGPNKGPTVDEDALREARSFVAEDSS